MIDTKDKYVQIGLIAGGIYLGYKAISWLIGKASAVQQAQNEVKRLVSQGMKPTYTESSSIAPIFSFSSFGGNPPKFIIDI